MAEEKPVLDHADQQENLRWEYREVATAHRFYVGLRFVIAAFTATLQSALLKFYNDALLAIEAGNAPHIELFGFNFILGTHPLSMAIVGIATMVAIFFMERRNIALFKVMIKRGQRIEFDLALKEGQFHRLTKSRSMRFITYTWSLAVIYGVLVAMWFYLLVLNGIALYQRSIS